jgi:flagellar biosynthesis protein FlhB
MAEEQGPDRTEKATPRRLDQAHREGNIAVGRDIAMVASLTAASVTLLISGPELRASLVALVGHGAGFFASGRPGDLLPLCLRPALLIGLAIVAGVCAATIATVIQTRGGFWPELALPDISRVFGAGRLRSLFKGEIGANLGLALAKNLALGAVLWLVLRDEIVTLPRLLTADPSSQLGALFAPFVRGAVRILATLAAIAGADLALTRLRFAKRMRMTREELKREFREDEGDPLLRARRRRRHREAVKGRVRIEVPRADVLIVNPTHIAVAIRYRTGEDRAPRVTAKGKGVIAEAMRALAREHGIPIVENVALARLLHKRVKVGRVVPVETYRAVAAVLAFVYRTMRRAGAAAGGSPS